MSKIIEFDQEAKSKLQKGVNKLGNAVSCTLGPFGRNVLYEENGEIRSTKDGVSVAKSITLDDPIENIGAEIVKQAAIKSASQAGDGTTTTTLLAQTMFNMALTDITRGSNVVEVKKGMEQAAKEVIEYLRTKVSKDITDEKQLQQIASISANNDEITGKIIAEALNKVGRDGVVSIAESKTGDTYLETVEGMQFDRGYKSPYFVTNNQSMLSTLENPSILIYDGKINTAKELIPTLENISQKGTSLLIIAEDIEDEALATLIVNKMRGTLKVCAVKAPDFGDRKTAILEDIATITGGKVMSKLKGHNLLKMTSLDVALNLGTASSVNIGKEQTTIIDGKGNETEILNRAEDIKNQLDKSTSTFETEKLQERLAKMTSGVAIIHVGGSNEIEIKEYKDRVEDALFATKAAIEEGILPGGGSALLFAGKSISSNKNVSPHFNIGKNIVKESCIAPFMKIMSNAGMSESECYSIIGDFRGKSNWTGFNPKTDKIINMLEHGILDPTKVTRLALENAIAVVGTLITTEAVVYNKPEPKSDKNEDYSGM